MPATSITEKIEKEQIEDNISDVPVKKTEDKIDENKLASLKAKNQANQKQQEQKMSNKIIAKKEKVISLGVIGTGQCGGKLASTFNKFGYSAICLNTSIQDLKYIDIPDSNKLLLEYGVGGASKERSLGQQAFDLNKDAVNQLINDKLADCPMYLVCSSLGGGSGSGSLLSLVDLLSTHEKPILVMCALPLETEDEHTKSNSLEALSELSSYTKDKKISNLIVVDNSKIESIFASVSQMDFYELANKEIVEPIDLLNTFAALPSSVKSLDPLELTKLLIDGMGLSVYGQMSIKDYKEDTSIAESIINNLTNGLLASGFNLKETKYAGFIISANKEVWKNISSSSINYASAMISDITGNSVKAIFKGIYTSDDPEDCVKVISMFSGLGLPQSRVEELKQQTIELQGKVKNREENRNLTLQLDNGKAQVSEAQKIKDKIAQKSSVFGKFVNGSIDRRK